MTQMAASLPARWLREASQMIAQERGGLAIVPAPKAGTGLMNEET